MRSSLQVTLLLVMGALVAVSCGGADRAVDPGPPEPAVVERIGKADLPDLPDPCLPTVTCQVWGRCTTDAATGRCVVGSNADCRGALFCANAGYCTRIASKDGPACLPGKDADCKQSHVCAQFGQCTWHPDHTCR